MWFGPTEGELVGRVRTGLPGPGRELWGWRSEFSSRGAEGIIFILPTAEIILNNCILCKAIFNFSLFSKKEITFQFRIKCCRKFT